MKVITKLVKNSLSGIFILIICSLAFIVLSSRLTGGEPAIMGHQLKAVLSGSMEPVFQTGSVISIKLGKDPFTYKKGDIITFQMDEKLITHRVIKVIDQNGQAAYQTKGDNNNGPDMWTVQPGQIIGEYSGFTIPYAGYAMNYANSKAGSALLLIVPGALLILSAFRTIFTAVKEMELTKAG
ncbi:signal peptidase I [Metabacillus idriensis]|uniref:Signal peptidase I n=1 Tax=Metabacillus idriensis TaxID=324768 RepID=A0A6I2MCP0_9BACI|nr:signal peptidase I [Metabacillus idriensis]MCM3598264.1 signal peptidase I [Metabacillus idriensis]MRX55114.1 signal peptidase I [Metabacillus idriensis]OHR71820.1 S26 family signal peptidase [Bacillus sp. HMSC76G11]